MTILSLFKFGNQQKTVVQDTHTARTIFLLSPPDATISFFTEHYPWISTNPQTASHIIHPYLLRDPSDIANQLIGLSKTYKKYKRRAIVFILSDYEEHYKRVSNLILLRTSARRSLLASNEWILPYLWESAGEFFVPSPLGEKPLIGFCGMIASNRQALISAFENDHRFDCRFIKRDGFWGGKPHDPILMQEFWKNMRSSQFMLAGRGAGNFSMRFYQALSMGRIPVLVDTDMELPLSDLIDWNELIVFEKTEQACAEKVMGIHEAGQTAERQHKCYKAYQQYLSEKHFLNNLLHAIDARQSNRGN